LIELSVFFSINWKKVHIKCLKIIINIFFYTSIFLKKWFHKHTSFSILYNRRDNYSGWDLVWFKIDDDDDVKHIHVWCWTKGTWEVGSESFSSHKNGTKLNYVYNFIFNNDGWWRFRILRIPHFHNWSTLPTLFPNIFLSQTKINQHHKSFLSSLLSSFTLIMHKAQ